jgi:HEAT repeat protein
MADDKYSSLRALEAMQVRSLEGKKEYVASLEARGDEQALSLLVECLCDESGFLRDLAERALIRLGPGAVDVLLPHLTQGLWFTRTSVARVLGEIGAREALPGLVEMAGDANRAVAESACSAMIRVALAGHVVSVARALHRAPSGVAEEILAGAESAQAGLAAQLQRVLSDRELMTAREDELLSETPGSFGAQEGVEWEILTGRRVSGSEGPTSRPATEA